MGLTGPDEGFDLYVGRAGVGTLELTAGGRAEIHDAVIVGDMPGSIGTIIVDGIDSFLGSGGLEQRNIREIHQIVIGRQGTGFMTIRMGVRCSARQPNGADQFDTIGAVIGSDPQLSQADEPEPGGRGEVNVVGPYSRWIVDGSMQVGGFPGGQRRNRLSRAGRSWNTTARRGAARCALRAAAWCNIRPAIDADVDNDELRLLIGRFGRVVLAGGQIQLGYPGDDDGTTFRLLTTA